jgi:hypothetical protein
MVFSSFVTIGGRRERREGREERRLARKGGRRREREK